MNHNEAVDALGNWLGVGSIEARVEYLRILSANVAAIQANPEWATDTDALVVRAATELTHATIAALTEAK